MTYGFLAVFAAGVALRRVEQRDSVRTPVAAAASAHADPLQPNEELAVDPQKASAFMAHAVLSFNEQIERIGEVVAVVAVGMLLSSLDWSQVSWVFVATMLLVVRPVAVLLGLAGARTTRTQKAFIAWFGIRGVGSLYYLMYAVNHDLPRDLVDPLAATVLTVIVVSVVAHGVSVTPLMRLYDRAAEYRR
jgi:NhaP-type Na+/H+ or K+/H+ antiporter